MITSEWKYMYVYKISGLSFYLQCLLYHKSLYLQYNYIYFFQFFQEGSINRKLFQSIDVPLIFLSILSNNLITEYRILGYAVSLGYSLLSPFPPPLLFFFCFNLTGLLHTKSIFSFLQSHLSMDLFLILSKIQCSLSNLGIFSYISSVLFSFITFFRIILYLHKFSQINGGRSISIVHRLNLPFIISISFFLGGMQGNTRDQPAS